MSSEGGQDTKVMDRESLSARLDRELDELVAEGARKTEERRKANPNSPEFRTQSVDELAAELAQNPFFMTKIDTTKPLPQMVQNVVDWVYETDDKEEYATNYKDDGNNNFKIKKFRWAIDSYTEGIKAECSNRELNAILYANRAACHFRLGNYRSSYKDCVLSRKFKPDHVKAIMRGAECCVHLKDFGTATRWCDAGLLIDPKDSKFLELRQKAVISQKTQEKEERKRAIKEKKKRKEEEDLLAAIKSSGVHLDFTKPDDVEASEVTSLLVSSLDSQHPSGAKVHMNSEGSLTWPVMFFYPEYKETDYIQEFHEDSRFMDHLGHMFGEDVPPPPWDEEKKYQPTSINIYFEDTENERLYKVKKSSTLKSAISHDRYLVKGGTPGFILLARGSKFEKDFLKKYKMP